VLQNGVGYGGRALTNAQTCWLPTELDFAVFCFSFRATNHTKLNLSPFEPTFGRKMSIGMPAELTDVLPKFPDKQQCYLIWLQHRLSELHASVNLNIEDNKREMKRSYDRRMKVHSPKREIGDKILLLDPRIQPGSSQIVNLR